MHIIDGIATVLGYIIHFIYENISFHNYGVAIIIFTIIVRIFLLPLNIKQQKSMLRMKAINPLLSKLQAKYKDDKEKLNQETMKLYKEYNVNPMAGCLPLLIQLPILFALIRVIYDPARFLFGADTTGIRDISEKFSLAVEYGLKPTFLGIDLIKTPSFFLINTLWIFPLLATAATYLSGKITQNTQGTPASADDSAAKTSNMMSTIFPIMTLFFTFQMPVAASFYWFISSAIQIAQTFVLNKVIKVDDISIDDGGNWYERNSKKRKNG